MKNISKLSVIIFLFFCLQVRGQLIDSLDYYYDKGDINKAITFGEKSKKNFELEKKTDNPDYATFLNNLAYLYNIQGDYQRAEPLYLQSLATRKKVLGEDHPDYATSLNDLAELYRDQGNYVKAQPLYLQSLAIRKKVLGENHPDYARSLNNLAYLYNIQGDYQKAAPLYLQSLDIKKKVLGENHPSYATSLNNLAILYFNQGNYVKAAPLYLQSLAITKKVLGENHPSYATSLNNLAYLYNIQGDYQKAAPLYLQSLAIRKKVLGEDHPDYATSLNNLALLYVDQGDYEKAESLYLQSLAITKKVLGEDHPEYATFLNNLASLYADQGNYVKAESLYLQSLVIRKKILGEDHLDYAGSLNNLALLYSDQGDYQKAAPLYLQSSAIIKKVLGEDHLDYATSLNNLALLYSDQGNYVKAQSLYLQSLAIIKKVLGVNHPVYAKYLNNLAQLYFYQGNYVKAESLYLQSSAIIKKVLGENHPLYAISLNDLGLFYNFQANFVKAEPLILQSLEITKKALGVNHPEYAKYLGNLASLYLNQGNYVKAEPLILQSLGIKKKTIGVNHLDYARSLNDLGLLYIYQANFVKAEPLILQSLKITKKAVGVNHSEYAKYLGNLATIYSHQGKYKKAEHLYLQSFEIIKQTLGKNDPDYTNSLNHLALLYQYIKPENKEKAVFYLQASFLPFQHQITLARTYMIEKEFNFFRIKKIKDRLIPLSFLYRNPIQYDSITIGCYENELIVKNLSLSNHDQIINQIKKSEDKDLQNKYKQFVQNRKKLSKFDELPIDKRPSNYEQINTENEIIEKELVKKSAAFANSKNALSINWKQVQDKLKPNELAIDLVAFSYHNKKWTDSIVYSAFVIGRDYRVPKFIPLFEQKQLELLLTSDNEAKRMDKNYTEKALSDLFLKPLEKELKDISTIYLSPSGLGYQIDFSALPISETQTLGEKYKVHILGSTAEIVNYKVAHLDKNNQFELLLYGDIDYDKSEGLKTNTNATLEKNRNEEFVGLATRSGITKWNYLAGTKKEIQQIKNNSQQYGFSTVIINDRQATEESIKKLDGRSTPYVLHLATHGFFFPAPKQDLPKDIFSEQGKAKIYKTSDDPMMRSGLLFAGANNYWGKPTYNTTTDDGILISNEISNLDLSACQLVVLSACDTGLGDIKGSEGVFGLQRAFKMAGVKNIIMSLWKVPDAQTAELFDIFYGECFTGKSIHEAFQIAQFKMKAKYSPYYWAAFVLLE